MRTIVISDGKRLGQVVRQRRRELGIDQGGLAALASTSRRFVSALEGGKPTVRLDKLLGVIESLGLELRLTLRDADRGQG